MANLIGSQLDGLFYEVIDWFYVIETLTLYGLRREKKNLGYDFV